MCCFFRGPMVHDKMFGMIDVGNDCIGTYLCTIYAHDGSMSSSRSSIEPNVLPIEFCDPKISMCFSVSCMTKDYNLLTLYFSTVLLLCMIPMVPVSGGS